MMRQNSRVDIYHWQKLLQSMELPESDQIHADLVVAYGEKHRAYHTLEHIGACLRHLDIVSSQAANPDEIEMAFWFHDAIYNPFSGTNEEDSAEWAKEFLISSGASHDMASRIFDLIILTKDHMSPASSDGKLMLDIDLSILGASEEVYKRFEGYIREEYRRVPKFLFKRKRKQILKTFLERPRIYHHPYFYDRLEAQARTNLAWAISAL